MQRVILKQSETRAYSYSCTICITREWLFSLLGKHRNASFNRSVVMLPFD